jgi:hypothetical protein
MGYGIEWMNAVGLWVASLPGAFGRVSLFGVGPLLLATAGFLVIGLLKTPLRWSGTLAGDPRCGLGRIRAASGPSIRRGRKISTDHGRRPRHNAKRLPARSRNPARPRSVVAHLTRRRAKRISRRISRPRSFPRKRESRIRTHLCERWVPASAGTSSCRAIFNTAGTGRPACPGCARGWAEGCEPHRPYWPAQAQWKRRGGGNA